MTQQLKDIIDEKIKQSFASGLASGMYWDVIRETSLNSVQLER